MKDKWLENVKTGVLVVLVLLSFVLTGSLWYMTPAYEEKQDLYRPLHYIGDLKYNQKQLYQLTSPPYLLMHQMGTHYWLKPGDQGYDESIEMLAKMEMSYYHELKTDANDWKYLFQQTNGIELSFLQDIQINTLATFLQMEEEDQESLKNLKVISRVWLFPDPQMKQVNVWFIDDSAARIIQATTNIPIFQFEQKFSQDPIPSTQKLEPIAINGKAPWDPANNNTPFSRILYLPTQSMPIQKFIYQPSNIAIDDMKQFLFSVDNITPTELNNGELVYAYDRRTLTYNKKDDYVVYIGPMPELADSEKNLKPSLEHLNKFLSDHRGWTGDYLLDDVYLNGNVYRYTFRLIKQGYPVFWKGPSEQPKQYLDTIQFQTEKAEKKYQRYMYFLPEEPANVTEEELLDRKGVLDYLSKAKISLEKIERIYPGYQANWITNSKKEKQIILEPVWVVKTLNGKQELIPSLAEGGNDQNGLE